MGNEMREIITDSIEYKNILEITMKTNLKTLNWYRHLYYIYIIKYKKPKQIRDRKCQAKVISLVTVLYFYRKVITWILHTFFYRIRKKYFPVYTIKSPLLWYKDMAKKEIIYRSVLFINIDVKILNKIAYEMQCYIKEIRYILTEVEFL